MASAKIVTLVVRTLAKPIATHLKHQAAEHPTFRSLCVGLAQRMHRVEMRMRSNLLGANTEHQKIRPLSENKAIANGANAISEAFLFAVAAALIIGESYRSARSNAKQRNRTEEAVEEVRETLGEVLRILGVDEAEMERRRARRRDAAAAKETGAAEDKAQEREHDIDLEAQHLPPPPPITTTTATSEADLERARLQRAVQVLLHLALRSGWIQGEEALDLDAILAGRDERRQGEPADEGRRRDGGAAVSPAQGGQDSRDQRGGEQSTGTGTSVQDRIAALGRSNIVVLPSSTSTSASTSAKPASPIPEVS